MKRILVTFSFALSIISTNCQTTAIRVNKSGKGTPVLFLPGFTTPGSVWKETINHLTTKKQSYVVSYAGFNGIAPIDTPWYDNVKKALIAYIVKEKLSGLTIIGHSMGGNLAIDIAAALPQKVNRIILVDAIPCMRELMMPGVTASQIQYNSDYNNQTLQMHDTLFNKMAVMMASNMTANKQKMDTLTKWILEADRKTYVYGFTDLLKLDQRDGLKRIKANTLILGASFPSTEIAKANFEKQYANLSNKTIEMADKSKHFIMFDRPEWFYDRVNSFLEK